MSTLMSPPAQRHRDSLECVHLASVRDDEGQPTRGVPTPAKLLPRTPLSALKSAPRRVPLGDTPSRAAHSPHPLLKSGALRILSSAPRTFDNGNDARASPPSPQGLDDAHAAPSSATTTPPSSSASAPHLDDGLHSGARRVQPDPNQTLVPGLQPLAPTPSKAEAGSSVRLAAVRAGAPTRSALGVDAKHVVTPVRRSLRHPTGCPNEEVLANTGFLYTPNPLLQTRGLAAEEGAAEASSGEAAQKAPEPFARNASPSTREVSPQHARDAAPTLPPTTSAAGDATAKGPPLAGELPGADPETRAASPILGGQPAPSRRSMRSADQA